jgi:predicted HD phosphohydrolase
MQAAGIGAAATLALAPTALRLAPLPAMTLPELDTWTGGSSIEFNRSAHVALALLRSQEKGNQFAEAGDLRHALQCATRALRNGENDEYVVSALLHDVGQHLNPGNHGNLAADLLQFRVSDRNLWMVAHHDMFQHSARHARFDFDIAPRWRGHPHFEATLRFCEIYDMQSLSADGEVIPLREFERIVHRVFAAGDRDSL